MVQGNIISNIFLFINKSNDEQNRYEMVKTSCFKRSRLIYRNNTLRANLKRGNYKIVVTLSTFITTFDFLFGYFKYLQGMVGKEFVFRFAASKICSMKKVETQNEKIENIIVDLIDKISNPKLIKYLKHSGCY